MQSPTDTITRVYPNRRHLCRPCSPVLFGSACRKLLPLEPSSSSSEHVPESLPEIPCDQPDPAQPEEDLFHISVGVILAGAGILTALIVGIWAVASHRRRRREIE